MRDSLDILCTNYEVKEETCNEIETVYHDSLNILRTDVICHHGILGMKWGIRRYQNKDGSLTAAGRKRYYQYPYAPYGQKASLLTRKGTKALKNKDGSWKDTPAGQFAKNEEEKNIRWESDLLKKQEEARQKYEKKNQQYRKELDILNEERRVQGYRNKDPKVVKRMDDAADLGLRALELKTSLDNKKPIDKEFIKSTANNPLEKTTVIDSMGYNDDIETKKAIKSAKDWFNWEDQTIGYTQIADLINQGHSKEKVKDARNALKWVPKGQDADDIAFEMDYVDDNFIDACYLIKEAQKNKSK